MGSSSKNRGGGGMPQFSTAPPTGSVKGPGGVVNKFYEDPSLVPQAGGLVRPPTGPGGPAQGIGLNFVTPPAPAPQRQQLAQSMAGGNNGIYRRGRNRMEGVYRRGRGSIS